MTVGYYIFGVIVLLIVSLFVYDKFFRKQAPKQNLPGREAPDERDL